MLVKKRLVFPAQRCKTCREPLRKLKDGGMRKGSHGGKLRQERVAREWIKNSRETSSLIYKTTVEGVAV